MKKRMISMVFALAILLTIVPMEAAADASYQLNQYSVSIGNVKSGTMSVNFSVYGMSPMAQIGAMSIVIEKQVAPNVWQEHKRFGGQYAYDSLYKGGRLEFSVLPNIIYRATLHAYAGDYNGKSDTGVVTSGSVRASF